MSLDLQNIEQQTKTALSLSDIKITNNEENAKASTIIRGLKNLQQTVKDTFRPHIQAAYVSWKSLIAEEKKHLEPIEKCEEILNQKIKEFFRIEEEKRIEDQRKIDELAKKEAEKEKAKLEKQAEKLMAKGNEEAAQQKLKEAETVTPVAPIVESKAIKQDGITTVEVWKFEIVNENLIPREYMMPDEKQIRKQVFAWKDKAIIPGVRIWSEKTLRVCK